MSPPRLQIVESAEGKIKPVDVFYLPSSSQQSNAEAAERMTHMIGTDAVYLAERNVLHGGSAIGVDHTDVGGCAILALGVLLLYERCHELASLEVRGEVFL